MKYMELFFLARTKMKAFFYTEAPLQSKRFWYTALSIAGILLLSLIFGNHLNGEYVWDDVFLVKNHPALHSAEGWKALLSTDLWGGAGEHRSQLYHPVPMMSLWAQAQLSFDSIVAFRIGNLLFHFLCGLALFNLSHRMKISLVSSAAATVVFWVHPSVVEPVMWITGRHDSLGVLFVLLALISWPLDADKRSNFRTIVSALFCSMAFMSKEPYIVAPILCIVFDWLFTHQKQKILERVIRHSILLLGIVLVFAIRYSLEISSSSQQMDASLFVHLKNYCSIFLHYLVQIVTFSQEPTIQSYIPVSNLKVLIVSLLLIATTGGLLHMLARKHNVKAISSGFAVMTIAILPHIVSLPLINMFANRYAYLPLVGFMIIFSSCSDFVLQQLHSPKYTRLSGAMFAITIAALSLSTQVSASFWRSPIKLYGKDMQVLPHDAKVLYHYGYAVLQRENCRKALPYFIEATRQDKNYQRAWHNRAGCLINLGDFSEAISSARHAFRLAPRNTGAMYNLGTALIYAGQKKEGKKYILKALKNDPNHNQSRTVLNQFFNE